MEATFSGLGAVNPILDKFPILSCSCSRPFSLSLARSLLEPPPALLHDTSTLGTHLPGTDRERDIYSLNTILLFPSETLIREHVHETHRGGEGVGQKGRFRSTNRPLGQMGFLTRLRTTATHGCGRPHTAMFVTVTSFSGRGLPHGFRLAKEKMGS